MHASHVIIIYELRLLYIYLFFFLCKSNEVVVALNPFSRGIRSFAAARKIRCRPRTGWPKVINQNQREPNNPVLTTKSSDTPPRCGRLSFAQPFPVFCRIIFTRVFTPRRSASTDQIVISLPPPLRPAAPLRRLFASTRIRCKTRLKSYRYNVLL